MFSAGKARLVFTRSMSMLFSSLDIVGDDCTLHREIDCGAVKILWLGQRLVNEVFLFTITIHCDFVSHSYLHSDNLQIRQCRGQLSHDLLVQSATNVEC